MWFTPSCTAVVCSLATIFWAHTLQTWPQRQNASDRKPVAPCTVCDLGRTAQGLQGIGTSFHTASVACHAAAAYKRRRWQVRSASKNGAFIEPPSFGCCASSGGGMGPVPRPKVDTSTFASSCDTPVVRAATNQIHSRTLGPECLALDLVFVRHMETSPSCVHGHCFKRLESFRSGFAPPQR